MTQFRERRGKSFISLGGEGKDQPADGIVVKLTVWLLNGDRESATRNPWLQGFCIWLWDLCTWGWSGWGFFLQQGRFLGREDETIFNLKQT